LNEDDHVFLPLAENSTLLGEFRSETRIDSEGKTISAVFARLRYAGTDWMRLYED
jgi:hypothetical protein